MNVDITNLKVKLNKNKDKLITTIAEAPDEFVGVLGGDELRPLSYNELPDNTIIYDGENSYTLEEGVIKKDDEELFSVNEQHYELTLDPDFVDPHEYLTGDTLTIGSLSISGVTPSYEYTLLRTSTMATLLPKSPTPVEEVLSYKVVSGKIEKTDEILGVINGVIQVINYKSKLPSNITSADKGTVEFGNYKISGDLYHFQTSTKAKHKFKLDNNDKEIDTLMWASNYCFYNTWLSNNGKHLATNDDGVYEGGFKVDLPTTIELPNNYSILYYNNVIIGVSHNNKTIIQDIDDCYFDKTTNQIWVKYGDNWYEITIEDGIKYSVIDDRYIAFNTTSYENTYDVELNRSFCRDDDYNGRILFITPDSEWDNNIWIKTDPALYSIYVASAINVHGLTTNDPVQGTIYPEFNACQAREGINYELLDFWSDAGRVVIEISYESEFKLSRGGSVNSYGKAYPGSSNTLYSVSELDTFTSTKNGYWLIRTPFFSAISAMSSIQTNTFSYYVGTMNELENTFLIQGSMYGITKGKMIVATTISNSSITSTVMVTYCGSLKYLGQTQDAAYFFDMSDRYIVEFTSNLTLNKLVECTSSEPTIIVNEPERNKIAMMLDDGAYVIDEGTIYHIPEHSDRMEYSNGYLLIGNKAYSKFLGDKTLPIVYKSGNIGSSLADTIDVTEVDLLLDVDETTTPPYLTYKISTDNEEGEERDITPDNSLIKLTPTFSRTEGLYFNVQLETNCNIRAMTFKVRAIENTVLTKNNG